MWEPCERKDATGYCIDYLMSGSAGDGHMNATINLSTSGKANEESCILQTLNTLFSNSADRAGAVNFDAARDLQDNTYNFSGNYDSYKYKPGVVAGGFWNAIKANAGLSTASYQDIRSNYVNCLAWADQRSDRYAAGQAHKGEYGGFAGGAGGAEYTCHDGTVFFSADTCSLVPYSAASSAGCSTVGSLSLQWLQGTPISLIFNAKSNPLATSTIVSFPLEPGKTGVRWEWRGSSDAPLLVYDPEHRGRITSAHQLFGPWTFGGKRVASLEQGAARSWSSGFEALAELDHDHDGEIRGVELQPLGLWFDENRDAISQAGEVKSSEDVGIVALRVAFERTDPKTGDLISSVGYDRLVDGKIVSGPSVDWIAHGAATSKELMLGALLDASAGSAATSQLFAEVDRTETSDSLTEVSSRVSGRKAHELVAGAWAVRMDDGEPQDGLSGFLLFNGGETSELNGVSLVELGAHFGETTARAVRFTSVEGAIQIDENSRGTLSFKSKSGKAKIENSATIAADGMIMKGKSVATRADGTQLRYQWTAKRIPLPERKADKQVAKK